MPFENLTKESQNLIDQIQEAAKTKTIEEVNPLIDKLNVRLETIEKANQGLLDDNELLKKQYANRVEAEANAKSVAQGEELGASWDEYAGKIYEMQQAKAGAPSQKADIISGTGITGAYFLSRSDSDEFFKSIRPHSLRQYCIELPTDSQYPDEKFDLPIIGQTDDGMLDDIEFAPVGEGHDVEQSGLGINSKTLETKEAGAYVLLTNKMLRNKKALSIWMQERLREASWRYENKNIISGNGVGRPLGFQDEDVFYAVARAGAGTIANTDIYSMRSHMITEREDQYVWIASQWTMGILESLVYSASGPPMLNQDTRKLAGLPLIWSEHASALGTASDLMLVNLKYYGLYYSQQLRMTVSKEYAITKLKTLIMADYSLDGAPLLLKPIKQQNGMYVSPFIGLN